MEDLLDGVLGSVWRLIRWFLIDAIIEGVCYAIGRYSLLLITLGRYPSDRQSEDHQGRIILFGILMLLLAFLGMALVLDI